MQQFVIIFRLAPGQLTETELSNRKLKIRAWFQQHNAAGHQLSARLLDPKGHWIGPNGLDGSSPAGGADAEVTAAIVFLEASAFEQAVEIARAHPGVQYGASIEIHPWSPPGPVSLPNPT